MTLVCICDFDNIIMLLVASVTEDSPSPCFTSTYVRICYLVHDIMHLSDVI